ncbi:Uncharacterised protein [Burkholderia pseudomallei]|nr:Uncharacterised protein [Burkholderia pseudomallei]CAJ7238687.1 Uncharacterised protein [Burkholderia pseudomallei]CAK0485601.1 Uncharacterised protein [Burkholderia pseudomallei]VBS88682.1 Uncharacterised protein [Burkholderia pseudomallei]
MCRNCPSLKFASTHTCRNCTTDISGTPGPTCCPICTDRCPTVPSTGDTIVVRFRFRYASLNCAAACCTAGFCSTGRSLPSARAASRCACAPASAACAFASDDFARASSSGATTSTDAPARARYACCASFRSASRAFTVCSYVCIDSRVFATCRTACASCACACANAAAASASSSRTSACPAFTCCVSATSTSVTVPWICAAICTTLPATYASSVSSLKRPTMNQ